MGGLLVTAMRGLNRAAARQGPSTLYQT